MSAQVMLAVLLLLVRPPATKLEMKVEFRSCPLCLLEVTEEVKALVSVGPGPWWLGLVLVAVVAVVALVLEVKDPAQSA